MEDQTRVLRMTLLALQEYVRVVGTNFDLSLSSAVVGQINSVFDEARKKIPSAVFPEFSRVSTKPSEVLPQIKLALDLLESSFPDTDPKLTDKETGAPVNKPVPQVFIGSSAEGSAEAKIIQMELAPKAKSVIWSQGVFGLSLGTLEVLVEKAPSFTHAILILTPDDMLTKRGDQAPAARDNVLFELGLFMGALGRERTYVVTEKSVRLPSDLAGVTTVPFERGEGINKVANMGPVVTKLQIAMGLL